MASGSIQGSTGNFLSGRRLKPLGAIAGAALLGAGFLATAQQTAFVATAAAQDQRPPSFADLAEKVRPAVVSVNVKSVSGESSARDLPIPDLPEDFRDFFDRFRRGQPDRHPMRAQGSGFLISADGYVVTNHHVAHKADEIEITFENEKKYKAKVIGSDKRTDIALLKIDTKDKFDKWLEFTTDAPRVGDWVLAVGNPFGLGGTVTAGIVSAQGRDIGSGPYDFLQIDAAVNRGNSGGPAVNLDGKVVGVNTAIYSPSGGSVGIAFAIPAATAMDVVQKLKEKGKVSSGWLGVQIQNMDDNLAEGLGLKDGKGALIAKILSDGPASKSDLKMEDVILEVNGQPVANSRALARMIAGFAPGSDARLHIFRKGKYRDVTVKLGEYPDTEKVAFVGGQSDEDPGKEVEDLGLVLVPAQELLGSRSKKGVAVASVDPNSKAADQGIKRGDIIVELNSKPVSTVEDVSAGIREARGKGKRVVLLQIRGRDKQSRFLALPIEKKSKHGKNKDKDGGRH